MGPTPYNENTRHKHQIVMSKPYFSLTWRSSMAQGILAIFLDDGEGYIVISIK